MVTRYQLLDMKNGKLVTTSFDDAKAPNAKVKLGMDQDVELLSESMKFKVGDRAGKDIIVSPDNIGALFIEAREQSRLDLEDEPAADNRISLIKHVVFKKMADEFVEQSIAAVEKDERALARSDEVMADDESYLPEQRKAAYEDKQYLDKILEAKWAEAYY